MKSAQLEMLSMLDNTDSDPFSEVPLDLYDLIPGFLKRREKEIGELRGFLKTGDFSAIGGVGHRLKGTGTGYGLSIYTDLGREFDSAGLSKDVEKIRSLIDQMEGLTKSLVEKWSARTRS